MRGACTDPAPVAVDAGGGGRSEVLVPVAVVVNTTGCEGRLPSTIV
jgi:hypothetical protein